MFARTPSTDTMSPMPQLRRQTLPSPLGPLQAVVAEHDGAETLTALSFEDRANPDTAYAGLSAALGCGVSDGRLPLHDEVDRQLAAYFAGTLRRFTFPLWMPGSAFRERVWRALLKIPFGNTTTYGRLATDLAAPGAQRAVGAANRANPIAIVVPCHRVVERGGGLRGYAGGLDRKRWLLEHEGARPACPGLFQDSAAAVHPASTKTLP